MRAWERTGADVMEGRRVLDVEYDCLLLGLGHSGRQCQHQYTPAQALAKALTELADEVEGVGRA